MATVNIAITATVAQLGAFADKLGYQEFVSSINPETNEIITSSNPQDRKDFLQEYFKRITVDELARVDIRAIETELRNQREADKQAVKDTLSNAVVVTFEA